MYCQFLLLLCEGAVFCDWEYEWESISPLFSYDDPSDTHSQFLAETKLECDVVLENFQNLKENSKSGDGGPQTIDIGLDLDECWGWENHTVTKTSAWLYLARYAEEEGWMSAYQLYQKAVEAAEEEGNPKLLITCQMKADELLVDENEEEADACCLLEEVKESLKKCDANASQPDPNLPDLKSEQLVPFTDFSPKNGRHIDQAKVAFPGERRRKAESTSRRSRGRHFHQRSHALHKAFGHRRSHLSHHKPKVYESTPSSRSRYGGSHSRCGLCQPPAHAY